MPSWSAPLVGPGLVVDLSRARDVSMRITFASSEAALQGALDTALDTAFDSAFSDEAGAHTSHTSGRAFGLPAATTSAVQAGSFVGDVRRGGSCNCETHVITPHGDGTHTEGVGHILHDRVPVLDLVDTGLVPALVVTVAPVRLDRVEDDVVGNHAPSDLVVDELSLSEAVARVLEHAPRGVKPRALLVRTAPGAQRRLEQFSGRNPAYFTVDAATWVTGHGYEHLLIDLPSLDREDDGGLLGAHRAFFDVPARSVHLKGPPPRRTITEMIAVDVDGANAVADGLYALSLQLAPLEADAVPSRPLLYPLVAAHPSWLRQERT